MSFSGQIKLRELPGQGSLLLKAMNSGIPLDGLPEAELVEDVREKPDDPQSLTLLAELESAFVKEQLSQKDAAMLYQKGIFFCKKYATGDIPKRALIDLVSPMSDELCSAFNLKTAKHLSNEVKVSKDSSLRWFPEEAANVIKVYYALFNASAHAPQNNAAE